MLKRALGFIVLSASTLVALVALEVGYRVYLSANLPAFAGFELKKTPNPTFSSFGSPPPWVFNEDYGFDYYEGVWRHIQVSEGKFDGCYSSTPNRSYERATDEYQKADFKILILGSSFTMVADEKGRLVNHVLEEILEAKTELDVGVANISRDATGMLVSFDIAANKLGELKPDLIMFVHNQSAFGYQRHWRVLPQLKEGFRQLTFSLDPHPDLNDSERVFPQPQIVTDIVDEDWCTEQNELKASGELDELDQQTIADLIEVRQQALNERALPLFTIDFWTLQNSFVYNFVAHQDPFHKMEMYKAKTVYGAVPYFDYAEDPRFMEAFSYLESTKIPYLLIHIPILAEMRAGFDGDIIHGLTGFAEEKSRSLEESLVALTGKDFYHLYGLYSDDLKDDPLGLVVSEENNHPNSKGMHEMAKALSIVVLEFLGKEGIVMSAGEGEKDTVQ